MDGEKMNELLKELHTMNDNLGMIVDALGEIENITDSMDELEKCVIVNRYGKSSISTTSFRGDMC